MKCAIARRRNIECTGLEKRGSQYSSVKFTTVQGGLGDLPPLCRIPTSGAEITFWRVVLGVSDALMTYFEEIIACMTIDLKAS